MRAITIAEYEQQRAKHREVVPLGNTEESQQRGYPKPPIAASLVMAGRGMSRMNVDVALSGHLREHYAESGLSEKKPCIKWD